MILEETALWQSRDALLYKAVALLGCRLVWSAVRRVNVIKVVGSMYKKIKWKAKIFQ